MGAEEIQYLFQIFHYGGLKNFVGLQVIENYLPHRNLIYFLKLYILAKILKSSKKSSTQ